MSVLVKGLTKQFGTQVAVDNLTFEVERGTILGFLGPNGAGKSTTMKMIMSYIEPTAGSCTVCGYDTQNQTLEARKKIGYLPEHNPLYKDMYVREFLEFVASIHKISNKKTRIDELIQMTGLKVEKHKKIQALSKGYRQRVGLAQALMHNPDVLILDEPTSGLDPNQLNDIRSLIRALGKDKTIIFSTHIMQEVTALCDQVLILNKGKLVAHDTIDNIQQRSTSDYCTLLTLEQNVDREELMKITGVKKVLSEGRSWSLYSDIDIRREVFLWAKMNDHIILNLGHEQQSVEDVFHHVTSN